MFHVKHAAREAAGAASRTRPDKGSRGRAEGRKGAAAGQGQSPCRAAEQAGCKVGAKRRARALPAPPGALQPCPYCRRAGAACRPCPARGGGGLPPLLLGNLFYLTIFRFCQAILAADPFYSLRSASLRASLGVVRY